MGKRNFTKAVTNRALEAQNHLCLYCLLPFGTLTNKGLQTIQSDHWRPYSWGDDDCSDNNIVVACQICNGLKSDHIFSDLESARRYILAKRVAKSIHVDWVPPVSSSADPRAWTAAYAAYLSS